jgi:hypothetical protein
MTIGTIGIVIITPGTMTVVTSAIVESGARPPRSGMAIATASVTRATGITIASVIGAGINRRISQTEQHYDYA